MPFKDWKIWFKMLPLSLKWFVLLILIRPIADLLYFLKEVSPVLSPLYLIGILTPLIIMVSYLSSRFPKKFPSFLTDISFKLWAFIVVLNLILLLISQNKDLGLIGDIIKYINPIFIFVYLRHFIRDKKDLHGILQAFYYSASIPAFLLLYEVIFNPINVEYLSEGRGGGARIQGGYADIMNYAIYINAALLIKFYFYLRGFYIKRIGSISSLAGLGVVTVICFMGLVSIKQTSSWMVAMALGLLFVTFIVRRLQGFVLVIVLLPVIAYFAITTYTTRIEPLVEKEYEVLEGEAEIDRSFNGRMTRWRKYSNIWLDMPLVNNLIGVGSSDDENVPVMIGGGMHSDIVRMLFLGGVAGLLFYLLFLTSTLRSLRYMQLPERFIVLGVLGSILLYSVSTTPLLYAPFIYFAFPVLSYAALPKPLLAPHG